MKRIDTINKSYGELKAELARLQGEVSRCQNAVAAAIRADAEIDELRRQRAQEVAKAFIDMREASVANIDGEIEATVVRSHQAHLDGDAARVALEVIEARCEELRIALQNTKDDAVAEFLSDLSKRLEDAEQRYAEAASAIGKHLVEMAAIGLLRNRLRGQHGASSRAELLFSQLESHGLKVIRTDGNAVPPAWMHGFRADTGTRANNLIAEIDKLGITT